MVDLGLPFADGHAAALPMALAKVAAKDAIRQNLAIPLQVAGYGEVTVQVRFDGEAG